MFIHIGKAWTDEKYKVSSSSSAGKLMVFKAVKVSQV